MKNTLSELESALSSWDQIVPNAETSGDAPSEASTQSKPRRPEAEAHQQEMKRRTRELLNQLKEQIDELSADEPTFN